MYLQSVSLLCAFDSSSTGMNKQSIAGSLTLAMQPPMKVLYSSSVRVKVSGLLLPLPSVAEGNQLLCVDTKSCFMPTPALPLRTRFRDSPGDPGVNVPSHAHFAGALSIPRLAPRSNDCAAGPRDQARAPSAAPPCCPYRSRHPSPPRSLRCRTWVSSARNPQGSLQYKSKDI